MSSRPKAPGSPAPSRTPKTETRHPSGVPLTYRRPKPEPPAPEKES